MDTVTLVDGFAVLRDIANQEPAYGRIVSTMSALVDRFVASSDMDKAMRMLVVQTIGFEVAASPLLLDTLCACFDNLDSKTGACEQLGIRRQTLYNRLDKVTQMVGVDYNDKPNWSMLLFAMPNSRNHGKNSMLNNAPAPLGNLSTSTPNGLIDDSRFSKYSRA